MRTRFVFALLLPLTLGAQAFVNRTYSSLFDVQAKSVARMGNGKFLVVGTQAFSQGFLAVHEATGACTQTEYLSPGALSNYSEFNQITKINDTLALIGGKISLAVGPTEIWQGITIAVNQEGTILWTLTHGVSDAGMDATITDIERLNDSTFLTTCSSIGNSRNSISKIDHHGTIHWSKFYDSNLSGFQLNDLCFLDSLIYSCGNSFSVGTYSGVLLTLDTLGNLLTGASYVHPSNPNFIQVMTHAGGLIVASRGNAMDAADLLKLTVNGAVVAQKTYQGAMIMQEDQALKPLSAKDSSHFWYWRGGNFGASAFEVESSTLLPSQALLHMGNIQYFKEEDTLFTMLSSGPLYGIKNQTIMQKHYSLQSADSLPELLAYCTYASNELPLNEVAPISSNFTPTVTNAGLPSPLFYPLIANEPWINEPFCVEMLGSLEEEALRFGPNPSHGEIMIDGFNGHPYLLVDNIGNTVDSGNIDSSGHIAFTHLASGSYHLIVSGRKTALIISH
jgi:hypothetical protein